MFHLSLDTKSRKYSSSFEVPYQAGWSSGRGGRNIKSNKNIRQVLCTLRTHLNTFRICGTNKNTPRYSHIFLYTIQFVINELSLYNKLPNIHVIHNIIYFFGVVNSYCWNMKVYFRSIFKRVILKNNWFTLKYFQLKILIDYREMKC